jgi:Bacterial Ig-like domain (group 2)
MPSDLVLLEEILQQLRSLAQANQSDRQFRHEVLEELRRSNRTLNKILAAESGPDLNDSISLTIPSQQGETSMGAPATLVMGQPAVQATAVESLAGVPQSTFNGPLAFSSDNTSAVTVDPASGLVSSVAVGTANVTVLDAIGNLSDSVAVTVIAGTTPPTQNDSISLQIPSQTASGRRR